MSKRGGSESQQKMNNIQQEVGYIYIYIYNIYISKRGGSESQQKIYKYPTAMSKRGGSESQQKMKQYVKKCIYTVVDLIDIHVFLVRSQLSSPFLTWPTRVLLDIHLC